MTAEVVPLAPRLKEAEFDCPECGRHIIAFCPRVFLCALCQMVPGWFREPGLAKILDPERGLAP